MQNGHRNIEYSVWDIRRDSRIPYRGQGWVDPIQYAIEKVNSYIENKIENDRLARMLKLH